jgi:protein O-GlcNAc transferase
LEAFDKAVAAQENVARYHHDRAEALRALGQWDEAIASYRAAIRVDPKYPLAHFNLGTARQTRNAPREAERSCRRAIALAPNDAQAHHYLGASLAQLGNAGEAIESYRHALSLDARGAPICNDLGIALERKGDIAGALGAFQQAIDLAPAFAIAYENAATLLQRRGDIAAASTFHRRRVEVERKSLGRASIWRTRCSAPVTKPVPCRNSTKPCAWIRARSRHAFAYA